MLTRRDLFKWAGAGLVALALPGMARLELGATRRMAPLGGRTVRRWCCWTGARSTDYNDPRNWVNGIAPRPGDNVAILGTYNRCDIPSTATIGTLTVYRGSVCLLDEKLQCPATITNSIIWSPEYAATYAVHS